MDMRDAILGSAEQITHSLDVNKDVRIEGEFDSIILAGLGGSGHPGDLLNALNLPTVPLLVHRSYDLPQTLFKNPLVICSSYSGNTEETISAYEAAKAQGHKVLVNTAGGALEKMSKTDGFPMTRIDYPGMQPRHTLFASFVGLVKALANSGLAQDVEPDLRRVATTLEQKTSGLEKPAQELVAKLENEVPVFVSSDALGFAAKNFKIQMNENVKNPAFWNTFPELNHNEMVGFSKVAGSQGPFHIVMLRDAQDHEYVKTRMDITKGLYEQWGLTVSEFYAEGETQLEKIFYTVVFGLWTTYHLALAYDIDPIPVDGVENFKAKLAEITG